LTAQGLSPCQTLSLVGCSLYAFDLIEHDGGEDMRNLPFLDRKAALARLLRDTEAGILFNEHIAEDGPIVFAYACRLGAEGIVSKKVDGAYQSGPCRVWIKVRNPASIAVRRERGEIWNHRRLRKFSWPDARQLWAHK
jgi:bifunctional non-homologous end joining protein LigD